MTDELSLTATGDDPQNSYDQLPYESHPFDRTHPDHLATIAQLFGLSTPDVDECRVLELGCAAGGNLIPMAVGIPEGRFLGVDLSRVQIEQGQEDIHSLGLENIQLQHRSIMDIGPDDGQFDYIVCHGVFSWVPPEVRDKILAISSENLAPNGVAYISYNTNPGWFLRGMVRQMMCFHARQFEQPQQQVEQARALLDFLIEAGPAGDPTYHALLTRELEILRGRADSYLYHEHLEEENEPVFFYEFNEQAESHGLRYLGEVEFPEMVASNYSPTAAETLQKLGVGLVHSEQYLDFLRNRTFRRTLLCHQQNDLRRQLDASCLERMHVSSQLRCLDRAPGLHHHGAVTFVAPSGVQATLEQPLAKASMMHLQQQWPDSTPFENLAAEAHRVLGNSPIRSADRVATENEQLGSMILELFAAGQVELRLRAPRYKVSLDERPLVSPLARAQAEKGPHVTNLRHDFVQLTDLQAQLVKMADGEHDRTAMCDKLEQLVDDGQLVIESKDAMASRDRLRALLMEMIESDLDKLRFDALLV